MSSNNPLNNDFGNSLRDSILEKKLKNLQLRVEQIEIDNEKVEQLLEKLDEFEQILNSKIRDEVEPNEDGENTYTLIFTTENIEPEEGI